MALYTFRVKQKSIPCLHVHSYEAEHTETGEVFALPQGGNGKYVGAYPEISKYLENCHCIKAQLTYATALGDKMEPDSTGGYKWTYHRNGHEIIVHDIARPSLDMSLAGSH